MGGYDEDLFAPGPGGPRRTQPLSPVVWLVIVLALVSLAVATIWVTQINKATSELQKVTSQLQQTQSSSGVGTGTSPSSVFQQVQQALASGTPTTPTP